MTKPFILGSAPCLRSALQRVFARRFRLRPKARTKMRIRKAAFSNAKIPAYGLAFFFFENLKIFLLLYLPLCGASFCTSLSKNLPLCLQIAAASVPAISALELGFALQTLESTTLRSSRKPEDSRKFIVRTSNSAA